MSAQEEVTRILVAITGRPAPICRQPEARLEGDLQVDSLALLEVVETLQDRLTITVPDEVTARLRTVRDLQDAVSALAAAAPPPSTTG